MAELDPEILADQAVLIGLVTPSQLRAAREAADDGSSEALLRAIHTATVAHPLFGANIRTPVPIDDTLPSLTETTDEKPDAAFLGPREAEVLRLIALGMEPPEIARSLSVGPTMIDVYRRNIARKLNVAPDRALEEYARGWLLRRDIGKTT